MKPNLSCIAVAIASALSLTIAHANEAKHTLPDETETIVVVGEMTNFSVTDTELENYQAHDIEDIFRTDPSVTVGGSIGVAQKVYVRGLEDTYLNVTVDGAPQTSTLFHHIGRLSIDPYLLKSVEVQAGAGEATSGFGAIGGAIRFKTKSVEDLLEPGERFGASVNAGYFSNEGHRSSVSLYGEVNDSWGLLGSFVQVENDEMKDGGGNDINGSSSDRALGFIKLNGQLSDNQLLTLSYESRNEEGKFSQRPNWPALDNAVLYPLELQRDTVIVNHTYDSSQLVNLETTLYYTQADVTQDIYDRWGQYKGEVTTVGFDLRNTSIAGDHSVTYGVEYKEDEATAKSLEPGAAPELKEEGEVLAFYAQDHWQITDPLLLSFGARFDRYSMTQKSTSTTVDSDGFSPNVGLNYQITQSVKLNAGYAQAMRGKQIGDTFTLESYGIDPNITEETVDNTEVGLEYYNGDLLLSATIYQSTIDDVIQARRDSRQYENVGKLETKGYELKAQYWYQDLIATATFNSFDSELNGNTVEGYEHIGLANSRGDTLGLNLTYSPTQSIELGWNYTYVADLNGIEVLHDSVEYGWIAETQHIDKPGYQLHDIYAQWYPLNGEELSINFAVTNLFDELYRDHSSVGDYSSIPGWETVSGVYAAGRDIRVAVNYNF